MIPKFPGWVNYLCLFAFYNLIAFGLKLLTGAKAENWFIILVAACAAGMYLAKWTWFEETLPDGTKKIWHRFW